MVGERDKMTRDEILAMKPGRSLNARVAEDVMGNKVLADAIMGEIEIHSTTKGESVYGKLTPYSEDRSSAQSVIRMMAHLGYAEAKLWGNEERPDVICRAALLTLLDKKKKEEKEKMKAKLHVVK